ncbi:hypothetical protein ACP275_08G037200 [Erythranthe tilingii]
MRNQWLRLLLLRCHTPSQPRVAQVHHLRSFTSAILHPRAPHVTPKPFPLRHHFASSPASAVYPPKPLSDEAVQLVDAFAKSGGSVDEIKLDLDLKNVIVTHDLILSVLGHPDTDSDAAKRIFDWVLESQSEKLSSKSYNLILKIFSRNGLVKETWDMIESMKTKGFGVSKGAFIEMSEKFQKDGLSSDVEKLNELFASGSKNNASKLNDLEKICWSITKIVKSEVWGDVVEKQLLEVGAKFSSDLVTKVLENLEIDPNKALIFFRWLEGSDLFEHDQRSYNAMARVLSKEDHTEKFCRFVNEMRSEGHEMQRDTYVRILESFVKRKMMKDAVDLYEFAMIGGNKPSSQDCIFLLKKIVVDEELDMDLFSKVLGIFKASGNVLTDSNLDSIIKSLTSVGKMTECNGILSAMEEHGYVPSDSSRSKIAFKLSKGGKTEEAREFMDNLSTTRNASDYGTWVSLVKGYCEARNLDEASRSFREMVEKEGASFGAQPLLDLLVVTYCREDKPLDAYKFVSEMVNDKGLSPWNATYKTLTSKLLTERMYFKEAIDVMTMMKNQDYAPDLASFVKYLSKTGSAEEAIVFTQAMSSKRFPSTDVFLRLFDAYLKAGRKSEAQDFLSKCPSYIKSHADVLELFYSRKSRGTKTKAVAVAV